MGGYAYRARARSSGELADPVLEVDDRNTVLYIDGQQLTRKSVSAQLAVGLPEWVIKSAASAPGYQPERSGKKPLLVILNKHGASVDEPAIAREMARIAACWPNAPLILLSEAYHSSDLAQAVGLGVRGYILTDLPIWQAVAAIRIVSKGGLYVPANVITSNAPQEEERPSLQSQANQGNRVDFSRRQLQVIALLHQGKQNKTIAHELRVSENTVKVYVQQIMKKLHASNRTQVVLQTQHFG